jgi:hypothetical protein
MDDIKARVSASLDYRFAVLPLVPDILMLGQIALGVEG